MKKIFLLVSVLILLALLTLVFVRITGGKFFKKAARETYELGKDMDRLQEDMIGKEKKIKKKIDKKIDNIKERY